jgi:hypothetical protein
MANRSYSSVLFVALRAQITIHVPLSMQCSKLVHLPAGLQQLQAETHLAVGTQCFNAYIALYDILFSDKHIVAKGFLPGATNLLLLLLLLLPVSEFVLPGVQLFDSITTAF